MCCMLASVICQLYINIIWAYTCGQEHCSYLHHHIFKFLHEFLFESIYESLNFQCLFPRVDYNIQDNRNLVFFADGCFQSLK